ncbi:MAG: nuclear transport factor 2 family protein [Caulobacterales bacterium]
MGEADIRELVSRFFAAIERGDIDTVSEIYAPDVVIWHNTDEAEAGREDNLRTLRWMVRNMPERSYRDRRVSVFDGGFVQQHVLHAVRGDGVSVTLPACIVCQVKGGRITRLDEYFDSARVAQFTAAAGA